ncbi:glutathione S-transferase [Alteromonas sediminis]|uniref:glutathione transferase n=1 Tax=Alteromonas sediminis TaxID=2259342 RepID=A0A3N5XX60_9ALTE|nr:glutathione S-transferase [Alteromonas sediminis]RPJ65362.1 glutathione S-transferase [Alteromonas sediminis]
MITLHHLNNSRSQRILWLLEELSAEYDIEFHERDKKTNLAPSSLKAVHPLGRAPVLTVGEHTLAESAAIIEYLISHYDQVGAFSYDVASEGQDYLFWMHFAEGSLMPALVANMVLEKAKGKVVFPLNVFIGKFVDAVKAAYFGPNLKSSLDFVEQHLSANHGFVGSGLTGVDFQMIFPLEALVASNRAERYPAITAYVKRMHQREAYQRALKKGGEYAYATPI